jgi:ribosomal protein L11 methyltransferase
MDNPFAQDVRPIILHCNTDEETAGVLELLAEDIASSTARVKHPHTTRFTAVVAASEEEELLARVARFEQHTQKKLQFERMALAETDWQKALAQDFPPLRIGRFFVVGSHITTHPPAAALPIIIDASQAFGTGEHGTTEGCLRAVEALCKRRKYFRMLDMGCGTAILALAMHMLTRRTVLAVDNDPVAVTVAERHVRMNKATRYVRSEVGNGYNHRPAQRRAPYDLLVANILARPLMRMAYPASRMLKPRATVVLSGLLHDQEAMVLSAHRMQRLYLIKRLRVGMWSVLVLRK